MCECNIEEQTVDHILPRCALTEEARRKDWNEGDASDAIKLLLYTDKGRAKAIEIWKEFKEAQR